jgi:hypothetical protein
MAESTIRIALKKVRDFLSYVAPITPIKTDDALVVVIDALLADVLLFGWFTVKVAEDQAGKLSLEAAEPPQELRGPLADRRIEWKKLIEMAPTIISLVKLFL